MRKIGGYVPQYAKTNRFGGYVYSRKNRAGMSNLSSLPIRIAVIAFCLVLLTTGLLKDLYASYKYEADASDLASVAKYEFDLSMKNSDSFVVDFTALKNPQSKNIETEFSVTNGSSEVAQRYTLVFADFDNLPLIYKLKNVDTGTVVDIQEGVELEYSFEAGTEQTHNYKLIALWDSTKTDYTLSEEIELITISIDSQQID